MTFFFNIVTGWEKKKKKKRRKKITDESGVNKYDLISLYLSLEPNISKKELRDIALNMIIAGRDTTRVLLSWFFYAIENKPQIIEKIKEDINAIEGDEISFNDASSQLYSALCYCLLYKYYTQCVLLETLRLYPSVSYSWRRARKDVNIPGKNFTLREGEVLNIHHFTMGRDKDIWGKDALIFNPMRWYDNLLETKSPYEYVQFHVPPRYYAKSICLFVVLFIL
ncbi:hypothetical protein RFI_02465 [Reticulomyxa filosa]|uniref:Cytochrome P450 n=1 Tax=Reticulomyxa filosa TaxID=46433 RepID=X6P7X0_RETFI|nr:hypothetical protein RFI_02465 [Reticulomyxa filosa]|eukprot:ETO34625.1 hypothetical protein RFI_02465 [Reticulomyxa filosa]